MVSSVQFKLTSESNATTPTFTLTCTSIGGAATTVSWTVNNSVVTEDHAHSITSRILTNAETATYNHTLMVTGRLVGDYECNVSNNRPSSASGMLAVVGKKCNCTHMYNGKTWWALNLANSLKWSLASFLSSNFVLMAYLTCNTELKQL